MPDDELKLAQLFSDLSEMAIGTSPPGSEGDLDQAFPDFDELSVDELQQLVQGTSCLRVLAQLRSQGSNRDNTPTLVASQPEFPRNIGRYQIERVLGEGGFARVFLATDPRLGRSVALKVPLQHTLDRADMQQRFQREAHAAAILDHPAIVPLYESGRADDTNYIAFAYCPGETLGQYLSRNGGTLPAKQAAAIVHHIAAAIGYAHSKGIVHRDLKPSNILISGSSEPSADDDSFIQSLRVADFGLVKELDLNDDVSSDGMTLQGQALGTPAYMSPEQVSGADVGKQSDVFALGAMLYQFLTGDPPHRRATFLDTIRSIESEQPRAIRSQTSSVPRDLAAICLRCLEKSPDSRYESGFELAADLDRFLQGNPVHARMIGSGERLMRWSKNHRNIAASLAFAFLCLTAASLFSFAKYRRASSDRAAALLAKQSADQEAQNSRRLLSSILTAFQKLDPMQGGNANMTAANVLEEAAASMKDQLQSSPQQRLQLLTSLAKAFDGVGRDRRALEYWSEASRLCDEKWGIDDPRSLSTLKQVAIAQQACGEVMASVETREDLLLRCEALSARGEEQTRLAIAEFGQTQSSSGKLPESMMSLQDNFTGSNGLPLHEISNSIVAELELFPAQDSVGRSVDTRKFEQLTKLIKLERRELEWARNAYGASHPATRVAMAALGRSLFAADQRRQACQMQQNLLELSRKELGMDHYETLLVQANLAAMLATPRQVREAMPLITQASEVASNRFDPGHPLSIRIENIRGLLLFLIGDKKQAIELHKRILETSSENLGQSHPETVSILGNYARESWAMGDVENAVPKIHQACNALKLTLGPTHHSYLALRLDLAHCLRWQGKREESLAIYREIRAAYKQQQGDENVGGTLIGPISWTLMELQRYEEAEKIITQWRAASESLGMKANATTTMMLAICLAETDRLQEADQLLVGLDTRTTPKRPLCVMASIQGLAAAERGDFDTAETLLLHAANKMIPQASRYSHVWREQAIALAQRVIKMYQLSDRPKPEEKWRKRLAGLMELHDVNTE